MALVIGLVVTMAMLGGMFGQTPMTLMTAKMGWRHAVMMNATFGILLLFLLWYFVRDYPKNLGKTHDNEQNKLHNMGFWKSVFLALRNKQNWFATNVMVRFIRMCSLI